MNSKPSAGDALFLQGSECYLDALTAIAAFKGEVQDMCAEIYRHHSSDLAAQLGLDDEACETFADDDPSERWAEVGISRSAQKDCTFCLYLLWGQDERVDGTVRGAVSLSFYHRRLRDEIHERFRQKQPRCRVEIFDTYTLVLYASLKDPASARDTLDALVTEWLDYCTSIGGLKLSERATP